MTSSTTNLWELWSEIVQDSDSLADPVLIDVFSAGSSHRVFDNISSEDLKSVLSKIKGLLNEPKSREKGAAIFNELVETVEEKRLVGVQDTLLTCLRLICNDKFLHSHIIQDALANFLPKCKNLPDVLKELTPKNAYISKIVASCIQELQGGAGTDDANLTKKQQKKQQLVRQPSAQVLKLLRVCLINFRGTCGNFREKLEKALVPYLDHDNAELVRIVCNILPLLSQVGGGGSKGDNHSKDWQAMVQKLIKEAYDSLYLLYSDCTSLDDENPFVIENSNLLQPLLPTIEDKKIFVKISKIKKRLGNILQAIGAYLRKSFPSHKPVPTKSLLKLISYLISVNPMELLASQKKQASRKELLFLAALLPSVHSSAFKLLNNVVICLGTNILPHAVTVEQLFSQQWRWMETNKNAFVDLKRSMYASLNRWLNMTKGHVSNPKTLKSWVEYFTQDIQLEKETVELKILGGGKSNKNKLQTRVPSISSKGISSTSCGDGLNPNNAFLQKSSETCEISLDILTKLLPSVDPALHKNLYCTIVKIHVQVYQQGTFPGQYESTKCRIKLNESLMGLALNPNARSSISLGLIINLLRKATLDPVSLVSKSCASSISILERLVHPSSQSLEFSSTQIAEHGGGGSGVDRSSIVLNNLMKNSMQMDIEESDDVDMRQQQREKEIEETAITVVDTGCQTDHNVIENGVDDNSEEDDMDEAQSKSQNKVVDFNLIMAELGNIKTQVGKLMSSSSSGQITTTSSLGQYHLSSTSNNSNTINNVQPRQIYQSGNKRGLTDNNESGNLVSNGHSSLMTDFETQSNVKKSKTQDLAGTEEGMSTTTVVSRSESEALLEMLGDFVDE